MGRPHIYVLGQPSSRGGDFELEGGVNAFQLEYVYIQVPRLGMRILFYRIQLLCFLLCSKLCLIMLENHAMLPKCTNIIKILFKNAT